MQQKMELVDNTLKKNTNNDRVTVENFELLVCRTCTVFETCGVRLYSVCYIGIRNGTSMCFPGGNQNIPVWDPSLCYSLLFVTFSHFLPLQFCRVTQRHLAEVGMFITGEKHTGYFEKNVYEDNLHGGPPAGMLMLVRIQSKYLQADWGGRIEKNRINERRP